MSGLSTIVQRQNDLHMVDNKRISKIPDLTLTNRDPQSFNNREGRCLIAAFNQYSIDVPRLLNIKVQGAITQFSYQLTQIIPDWDPENYAVINIQFPLQADVDNIMDQNFWTETLDPDTGLAILKFARNDPGNGSIYAAPVGDFVIWYQAPHVWDLCNNTTSIPPRHYEAVAQLAASYMLTLAARVAVQFSDQQVLANKDMGTLTQRLTTEAKACMDEYEKLIEKDDLGFSYVTVSWPTTGNGWMPFHPQGYLDA